MLSSFFSLWDLSKHGYVFINNMLLFKTCHNFEHFVSVCICSVPSNSRVLMLLGQLEKMDGDVTGKNVETTRQVTAKILHLIQTQGKGKTDVYSK